jgi:tRNA threonylcarbamoyladenosine biosynthesis protein TsaB
VTTLLAIETTEKLGSVAISEDGNVLHYLELPTGQRSAQSLVPTIQAVLQQVGWEIQSINTIAVATGPGSFTGLRVGLATARMLAYVIEAEIYGINTLQAIAANAVIHVDIAGINAEQKMTIAIDAQRGEVSAQTFQFVPGRYFRHQLFPKPIEERQLLSFAAWWRLADEKKRDTEKPLLFSGAILQKIAACKPENVSLVDPSLWQPNALGVSQIAWERIAFGEADNLWTLQPYYSRLSAAEEKKGLA